MIASVVDYKMFSRHVKELLVPGILGIMALIGLVLLYSELRRAARERKMKRSVMEFPSRQDRFRKAG